MRVVFVCTPANNKSTDVLLLIEELWFWRDEYVLSLRVRRVLHRTEIRTRSQCSLQTPSQQSGYFVWRPTSRTFENSLAGNHDNWIIRLSAIVDEPQVSILDCRLKTNTNREFLGEPTSKHDTRQDRDHVRDPQLFFFAEIGSSPT